MISGTHNSFNRSEVEISSTPLKEKPKDIRAEHCTTAKEYDLWKFSSDYQSYAGMGSLEMETGLHVGNGGKSEFVTE